MIYDIRHLTAYTYEAPVVFAHCTLRLTPVSGPDQRLLSHDIEVSPAPARQEIHESFFGHRSLVLRIDAPHRELRVTARSRVAVTRDPPPAPESGPVWETVREEAAAGMSLGPASPVHFMHPTRLVPLADPVTLYGEASFPKGRRLLDGVGELMARLHADFRYDPRATLVSTPLMEAFRARSGVCQDFAHIMIAALRGLGLPVAYVSGYLRTIPPAGAERLAGADATHAWVAVWCGRELGWIGFDPTNDIVVGNDHIVLAMGRDYADISPVDGVILGSGSQKLAVEVDVVPAD